MTGVKFINLPSHHLQLPILMPEMLANGVGLCSHQCVTSSQSVTCAVVSNITRRLYFAHKHNDCDLLKCLTLTQPIAPNVQFHPPRRDIWVCGLMLEGDAGKIHWELCENWVSLLTQLADILRSGHGSKKSKIKCCHTFIVKVYY